MQDDAPLSTPPRPARHPLLRVLGIAVRAPLGCLAFLIGLATVLTLAVPALVGSKAPDLLRGGLEGAFAGRFEVEEVDLAWLDRQRLEDLRVADPDGEPVARLSASVPSLVDLAQAIGGDFGESTVEVDATLVRFEDGSWNWQRAFAPDEGGGAEYEVEGGGSGGRSSGDEVDARLTLRVGRLTVEDRLPGGADGLLAIEDLELRARLEQGASTTIEGAGRFAAPNEGSLTLTADLGRQAGLGEGAFPFESFELVLDGVPVAWLDGFLQAGGALVAAVGPTARVEIEAATRDGRSDLEGSLVALGERGSARLPLQGAGGRIRLDPDQRAELRLEQPRGVVVSLLPAGVVERFELELDDGPWTLAIDALELDTRSGFEPAALAAHLSVDGTLTLGGFSARPVGDGQRVAVDGLTLDFGVAAGAAPSLGGEAPLTGGGVVRLAVVADPLADLLAAFEAGETVGARAQLDVEALPTSTVDALVATDGLLGAVLGERVDLALGAAPAGPAEDLELSLELRSPIAVATVQGRLAEGRLVPLDGGEPLTARFELSPLSSARVVGPLIPILSQVRTTPGGDRASIGLEAFTLPLDGDLEDLQGDLVLDLGDVRVTWIPGLSGLAGFEDERLGPYRLSIRDGRATYTDFPISVDGERFPLTGSVGLSDRSFELRAELPLRILGSDLVDFAGLDEAGDLRTPVTLARGPEGEVRIDLVDEDLVRDLARSKLGAVVEEELREVLGGNEELDEARKVLERVLGGQLPGGLGGLLGGKGQDG